MDHYPRPSVLRHDRILAPLWGLGDSPYHLGPIRGSRTLTTQRRRHAESLERVRGRGTGDPGALYLGLDDTVSSSASNASGRGFWEVSDECSEPSSTSTAGVAMTRRVSVVQLNTLQAHFEHLGLKNGVDEFDRDARQVVCPWCRQAEWWHVAELKTHGMCRTRKFPCRCPI